MNYQKNQKQLDYQLKKQKNKRNLRQEYLATFRSSMRETIENVKVIDPDRN